MEKQFLLIKIGTTQVLVTHQLRVAETTIDMVVEGDRTELKRSVPNKDYYFYHLSAALFFGY